ncbi:DUF5615 family PIN-like protein [Streptomyces tailanensis]|uniref:DUF5615 family PIN-like protein n=1 Tax=Streptomyces tailanensis TaxID=2569858 RepID=UPI00155A7246
MPRAFYKHKLIFDEHLPNRREFPRVNSHFDVKHIAHDLRKAGTPDAQVYELAVQLNRIVVTQNTKHFAPLAKARGGPGVIGIPPHWREDQVDSKLAALLTKHGPTYFEGQLVNLTD